MELGKMKTGEKGIAMPVVMFILAVISLTCMTVLILNENLTRNVSFSVNRENALHIAEAGYNQYVFALNDDPNFYQKTDGNRDMGFTVRSRYTSEPWTGYPSAYDTVTYRNGSVVLGFFNIQIVPPTVTNPVITVISTGWTADNPNVRKTIRVGVNKRRFSNYVDFSGTMSGVLWGSGEVINGPLFCNSNINISGTPKFMEYVGTHGYVVINGTTYRNSNMASTAMFAKGYNVQQQQLVFPGTNSDLAKWGKESLGGLTYTGTTAIMMNNSKLKILNGSTVTDNVSIPGSGVIYVNGNAFVSGVLDGRLTVCATGNIYITLKDPTNTDASKAAVTNGIKYAKDGNDIPASSTDTKTDISDDMLGLVSGGDVILATKTWPKSGGGTQSYSNYAPAKSSGSLIKSFYVRGALMASTGCYTVEEFSSLGELGSIYLIGSKIVKEAQATWNGSNSGYKENNTYDYRLLYETPPHFVEPTNSGWEVRGWEEVVNP